MEQYFLGMKQEIPVITSVSNIFEDLTKSLTNWTYQVLSDVEYKDSNDHALGIRLYIPGRILYTYICSAQQELENNIKKALYDCCSQITKPMTQAPQGYVAKEEPPIAEQLIETPKPVAPIAQPGQVPPEIMEMIEKNQKTVEENLQQAQPTKMDDTLENMFDEVSKEPVQNTKITTMEQLSKDERDQIPFEDIAENVANMMHTGINEDVPEDPRQFTPRQIAAMRDLKAKLHEIDPNENVEEVLARFINSWNPKYASKKDLTNRNVDDFVHYANRTLASMGK